MSLLMSIAAGIGLTLVAVVAVAVPFLVALLVVEFTDAGCLALPVFIIGLAVTLGALAGVTDYYQL